MEANSTFDIKGFLNDPKVQANKPAAVQYLQSKGIVDAQGNLIKQAPTAEVPTTSSGGFFKSLFSAPATILARPIQAVAELAGVSPETVDQVSNKLSGGLVAPTPKNFPDVKKDTGRAIETVALGAAGPISGGAAFGLGNSLEQGNDLLSFKTAFDVALGASAGKVLDLVGKPIFNVAGKVVGKVTPLTLKNIASKGTTAIQEFAAAHNILPENTSNLINSGAQKAETLAQKPFTVLGNTTKGVTSGVKALYQKEYPAVVPTQEQFNKAVTDISRQYEKVLPLTSTQKFKEGQMLSRTGDNVYTTLAKNGVNLGSEEAPQQLTQLSEKFSEATRYAQANEHGYFNVDEIKHNAFQHINESIPSETGRIAAKQKLSSEIDAIIESNSHAVHLSSSGDRLVKSEVVERLRKTGNSWTPFNSADPEKIGSSAGYALSNAVRDQVEKQGTFPAYREANREWGKILHAEEVLGKIEKSGKNFKVAGGLSGSVARKILSGALGYHTAGIGGAILGELGTEYASQILSNPELRTYFDRKITEKFLGSNPTPEAVAKLTEEVRNFIDKQSKLLKLPAPKSIRVGGKTGENSVRSISAKKNPVSANPKTGKFQTSYSSTPSE